MNRTILSALPVALFVACSSLPATPTPRTARPPASSAKPAASDPFVATIDAAAGAAIAAHKVVGLSVAVARGEQLFVKGYGFADITRKTPAAADTVYRIGSVTKQFTSVAILQLVDNGELALTDDLRKYLPDYP